MHRAKPDGLDSFNDSEFDTEKRIEETDLQKELAILSKYFDEKQLETKRLRTQLSTVLDEFERVQEELVDAQLIIDEQQSQLGYFRHEAAVNKTNYDDLKIQSLVQRSCPKDRSIEIELVRSDYVKLMEEMRLLRDELQNVNEISKSRFRECEQNRMLVNKKTDLECGGGNLLRREYNRLEERNQQDQSQCGLYKKSSKLRCNMQNNSNEDHCSIQLTNECNEADEMDGNPNETLSNLQKEKEHWEQYASTLIANIVEVNPELLKNKSVCETEDEVSRSEATRWHNYAMRLLSSAISLNPESIYDFDKKLLASMHKRNLDRKAIGCETFRVESASAMVQTKKSRKFDRLRKYFRK